MNKQLTKAVYPAILSHAEDGITITFPDLPGCISCAQTDEDAIFMARDALGAWIVATEDLGEPVPSPTTVTVPLWLNALAEKAGLSFSQVLQAGLKSSLGIQDR